MRVCQKLAGQVLASFDAQQNHMSPRADLFQHATVLKSGAYLIQIVGYRPVLSVPAIPAPGQQGILGAHVAVQRTAHCARVEGQSSVKFSMPRLVGVTAHQHRLANLGERPIKDCRIAIGIDGL